MKNLTNDEAREYFKSKKLTYKSVTPKSRNLLVKILQEELKAFKPKSGFLMTLKKPRAKDIDFNDDGLCDFYLRCKGTLKNGQERFTHFEEREAISFNGDGFIGFAGWADKTNVQPFLSAFIKWCDEVVGQLGEKLTKKQQILFDEIKSFIDAKSYPPTTRELVAKLKKKSTSSVHEMLKIIKSKGHISMEPGKSRTIKIVEL